MMLKKMEVIVLSAEEMAVIHRFGDILDFIARNTENDELATIVDTLQEGIFDLADFCEE